MPLHDDLGTRMKTYYEQIPKIKLMRRTPVAIRIDGKAFHTFTRGLHNMSGETAPCGRLHLIRLSANSCDFPGSGAGKSGLKFDSEGWDGALFVPAFPIGHKA